MEVLKEEECSGEAWLDYYDMTKDMLVGLRKKYFSDTKRLSEIREGLKEDGLVRKYGERYLGYVTFIMRKSI
ncbi:MAG TPA: hypothetical protein VFE98_05440 [Candidatus Bathyarchaeia archaeon]|nr:hypothetical protein [Candidatus Bathyarchaeia archaeon]